MPAATSAAQPPVAEFLIPTRDGDFVARYTDGGLASLSFPTARPVRSAATTTATPQILRWHRETTAALERALAGREPGKLPPLDDSLGTAFQRRVWSAMRKIKPGQTRSYGEIACDIGQPKAVRAVGGACGANPIPVFVPCHRVSAAHGKIGGFSCGLEWKRTLLAREGVTFDV